MTFLAKIQPPIAEKTDEEKGEEKHDGDIFKETFGGEEPVTIEETAKRIPQLAS